MNLICIMLSERSHKGYRLYDYIFMDSGKGKTRDAENRSVVARDCNGRRG